MFSHLCSAVIHLFFNTFHFQSCDDKCDDVFFVLETRDWNVGEILLVAVKGSLPSSCGTECKNFIAQAMRNPPGSEIDSLAANGMCYL